MKNIFLTIVFFAAYCTACSKKSPSSSPADTTPSNLTVSAKVSADSSGNVAFVASATNAVTYDFDFGNGVIQTAASGSINYKYTSSGTYSVNVIAKSAGGQTISQSVSVTVIVSQKLIWSDEFDSPGTPDPTKWSFDIGTGSGGWGNNELEYYTNRLSNASVANGFLTITASKENYSGSAYTSARMLSQNKFSFEYGKIDVRAKLPSALGTWPAIWMLGSNITTTAWPACGEMDIMEQRGSELNKIYSTLHYPGHSGSNGVSASLMATNTSTTFHDYILQWNAATISFYVDTQLVQTVANNSTLPFNQNFFVLLNLAMGGNFAGSVDPAFSSDSMVVDYVRVYQ